MRLKMLEIRGRTLKGVRLEDGKVLRCADELLAVGERLELHNHKTIRLEASRKLNNLAIFEWVALLLRI